MSDERGEHPDDEPRTGSSEDATRPPLFRDEAPTQRIPRSAPPPSNPPPERPHPSHETRILPVQSDATAPATEPAPGPASRPAPRPARRWPRKRWLLVPLAVLVLLPIIGYFVADARLERVQAFPGAGTRPAATPGTDWLIVGSDSRAGLSADERRKLATGTAAGRRTDTMMLMHIGSGGPTLVSLPRDSYVDIPGRGMNKLNAAFAFGGPRLLVRTVEAATDIRIDHYAEVGFGGVVDVVNAVGGVDLCVKERMRDPKAGLRLNKGCQELDGAEALGYARTRDSPRGDLDRVVRQRELLGALIDRVTSPTTVLNPFRLVPLATRGAGALQVADGDHLYDLARLAWNMRKLGGDGALTTTVPVAGTPTIAGVGSVVTWDDEDAAALFDALRADRPVPRRLLAG